jgi:hypothetical protein
LRYNERNGKNKNQYLSSGVSCVDASVLESVERMIKFWIWWRGCKCSAVSGEEASVVQLVERKIVFCS